MTLLGEKKCVLLLFLLFRQHLKILNVLLRTGVFLICAYSRADVTSFVALPSGNFSNSFQHAIDTIVCLIMKGVPDVI